MRRIERRRTQSVTNFIVDVSSQGGETQSFESLVTRRNQRHGIWEHDSQERRVKKMGQLVTAREALNGPLLAKFQRSVVNERSRKRGYRLVQNSSYGAPITRFFPLSPRSIYRNLKCLSSILGKDFVDGSLRILKFSTKFLKMRIVLAFEYVLKQNSRLVSQRRTGGTSTRCTSANPAKRKKPTERIAVRWSTKDEISPNTSGPTMAEAFPKNE